MAKKRGDRLGRSELHYAAVDQSVEKVAALIKAGANVNDADGNGWTPLHFAAQSQAVEIAKLLLEAGAEIDACDQNGNTALWRAVFTSKGNGQLIKLLREYGANPSLRNRSGISPLELARTIANYNVRQFFEDLPG